MVLYRRLYIPVPEDVRLSHGGLVVMNPTFLQLIACWMSILDPQLHSDGMFVNHQPEGKRTQCQICCLLESYSCVELIGNQDSAPIAFVVIST